MKTVELGAHLHPALTLPLRGHSEKVSWGGAPLKDRVRQKNWEAATTLRSRESILLLKQRKDSSKIHCSRVREGGGCGGGGGRGGRGSWSKALMDWV